MFTRQFEKSKVIHTLICVLLIFLMTLISSFYIEKQEFDLLNSGKVAFNIFIILITIFVLEFVKSKNRLTKRSSFTIITFSALLIAFPEILNNAKLLLSNFFVMLSLRRLLSIRTNVKIKKKILDSAIWISVATLFYSWASLFFIPIYISMFWFSVLDKKNLWIPLIGAVIIILFLTVYNLLFFDMFWVAERFDFSVSYDYTSYATVSKYLQITILLSVVVWLAIFNINIHQKLRIIYRPLQITIWMFILIALSIVVFTHNKNLGEMVFLAPVLSFTLGSFFDFSKDKIFKNIIFILILILPVLSVLELLYF